MMDKKLLIDIAQIPSPTFVLQEDLLIQNLELSYSQMILQRNKTFWLLNLKIGKHFYLNQFGGFY